MHAHIDNRSETAKTHKLTHTHLLNLSLVIGLERCRDGIVVDGSFCHSSGSFPLVTSYVPRVRLSYHSSVHGMEQNMMLERETRSIVARERYVVHSSRYWMDLFPSRQTAAFVGLFVCLGILRRNRQTNKPTRNTNQEQRLGETEQCCHLERSLAATTGLTASISTTTTTTTVVLQ